MATSTRRAGAARNPWAERVPYRRLARAGGEARARRRDERDRDRPM